MLADLYIQHRVAQMTNRRAAVALKAGQTPGPEGSLGKLMWTANMTRVSDAVSTILGPHLVADTGEWGTYAWGEHVLGAPGYRIAGGSDEIQRNIIGERVLGLPPEPTGRQGRPLRSRRSEPPAAAERLAAMRTRRWRHAGPTMPGTAPWPMASWCDGQRPRTRRGAPGPTHGRR